MALPRRVPLHVRGVGRTFAVPGVCLTCERLLGECGAVYNERVTLIELNTKYRTEGHLPFWVFGVQFPTA